MDHQALVSSICSDPWIIPASGEKTVPLGLTTGSSVVCLYVGSLFCEDEARLHIARGHLEVGDEISLCFGVTLIMHWQSFDVKG